MNKIINGYYRDASAGTGKTYWIVKTKLAEIYNKKDDLHKNGIDYDFSNILIVTFTEKAAGELRNRIREKYSDYDKVDEMHIFTIHSFCQHVISEYAAHVGKPSELSLVDAESDADSFIQKWIRDVLPFNQSFSQLFSDLKTLRKKDFSENVRNLRRDLSKAIQTYEPGIVIESKTDEKKLSYSDILSATIINEANKSVRLVEYLYNKWNEDKASRKVQTYNDMITGVYDAITRENSLLLKEMKAKYKVAIIDEFQDTNQLQLDIFSSIFDDKDHSLFVVGDPKQSIYAFQGADVDVYISATTNNLRPIKDKNSLINRRSSSEMIDGCNLLFSTENFFGEGSNIEFKTSDKPENNRNGILMELNGDCNAGPFWFPDTEVNEYEFARFAVDRIVFCCSKTTNGKTNLQIPRKEEIYENGKTIEKWKLDNVTLRDFAILARVSSEMKPIEQELRRRGIPYVKYKDRNLFNGLECQNWISMLNAIDADDFSGQSKRILSEVLYTKFFNVPINEVDDEKYSLPSHPNRKLLLRWHDMCRGKRWTEMIESIYQNSRLEESLVYEDKLQSLIKFRQIGNFILEYLYVNCCSLPDVCEKLSSLSARNNEDEGSLVERGTDKDCIQIMTIHAAKGLEFPIVIPVAGFKGRNNKIPQVYTYHQSGHRCIGFSQEKKNEKSAKDNYWDEQMQEWRRLFYVAYTRAKELMILPIYKKWDLKNNNNKENDFQFLKDSFDNYLAVEDNKYLRFPVPKDGNSNAHIQSPEIIDNEGVINQLNIISEISESSRKLSVFKHSYSSLSHPRKKKVSQIGSDKDLQETEQTKTESLKEFDSIAVSYSVFKGEESKDITDAKDPKGTDFGIAVHEVFQKTVFKMLDTLHQASCSSDSYDKDLEILITDCFTKQGIKLDEDGLIVDKTKEIVRNTLNAKLPEIRGNMINENYFFKLCELDENKKRVEAEFYLVPDDQAVFKNYCNGFVDLIFERERYYSIVDWKTDTKTSDGKPIDYASSESLKNRVDESYSIQRVLYSYCLIKWLKQWYPEDDEERIFNERFGGIYYVFVRGCVKDKRNGIYAQTWESWNDLKAAFNEIKSKKMFI